MVGVHGFHGHNPRLHWLERARQAGDEAVEVDIGGGVGVEAVRRRAEHVEIDHGVDVLHVGEGAVEEIPRPGAQVHGGSEGHQQHRTLEQHAVGAQLPGKLHQQGQAGGVAVGSVEYLLPALPVDGDGRSTEIVEPRPYDYVFVAQLGVVAGDEAYDVAGLQGVAVLLPDSEDLPVVAADYVNPVGRQDFGDIFRCGPLPFRAGLAALERGRGQIAHLLLHRFHDLAVVEVLPAVTELRGSCHPYEQRQEKDC